MYSNELRSATPGAECMSCQDNEHVSATCNVTDDKERAEIE